MAKTAWERMRDRLAVDPAYRIRVSQQQSASRRRRKERLRLGLEPECPHVGIDGRKCWLPLPHKHKATLTADTKVLDTGASR